MCVCVCVCSLSQECGPPGFSVHGNFQARLLDRVAISSSRGSSQPRDGTPSLLCLLYWQADSLPLSRWYIHQSIIKLFVEGDKLHNCMSNFRNSLWSIKSQRVASLLFLKYTPFFFFNSLCLFAILFAGNMFLFISLFLSVSFGVSVCICVSTVYKAILILKFSSVAQSCPTLCDPMECSTPAPPVHHKLPESTQTHVH